MSKVLLKHIYKVYEGGVRALTTSTLKSKIRNLSFLSVPPAVANRRRSE
jgi:hypothetical protein